MEIIKKQNEDLNLYVDVQVLRSDVLPLVEKELKNIRKQHPFPGFRPGNTPMSLVTKKFGKSVWWEELSKFAVTSVENYLKDEKIEIFGYPILTEGFSMSVENIDNFEEMTFPFFVGLKPTIDESSVYNSKLTKYNILISEEETEKVIEGYQKNFGSFTNSKKSNKESLLKVELTQCDAENNITENGIHVENTSILVKYIGKKEQKNFVGLTANDEKNADLKKVFENASELASILKIKVEEVETAESLYFKIKVIEIKNFVNAELNQDLFDKCFPKGEIKTVEEFRIKIKEDIERSYKLESNSIFKQEIKEEIEKQAENFIPLPEKFLKALLNRRTSEDTEEKPELTEEELQANYKFLRWDSFCEKITTENNITITEEELINEAKATVVQYIIQQYGQNFFPEETITEYAKNILNDPEKRMDMKYRMRDDKILESIMDKFQVEIKDVTVEELNSILKEKYQIPEEAEVLKDE